MSPARVPILLVGLAFLPFAAGCGASSTAPPSGLTVPVHGKILLKGKPVKGGSITFEPEDDGRGAHGGIEPDGTFRLTTFREDDGAVRGPHRVAVVGAVPLKYRNVSSSGIVVEVVEGRTDYEIILP